MILHMVVGAWSEYYSTFSGVYRKWPEKEQNIEWAAVLWEKISCCFDIRGKRRIARLLRADMKATVTPDNHLLLGKYTDEHLWMHMSDTCWSWWATGNWGFGSHQLTQTGQQRIDEILPGQTFGWWSQFALNSMKTWIHPNLYKRFRLLL